MKRIVTALLVVAMLIVVLFTGTASVSAATSGYCGASGSISGTGQNVSFSYNSTTKTLTLTGTGATKDYGDTALNRVPWYDYRGEIIRVEVGEGITGIGTLNFRSFTSLTSVSLPSTLKKIGGGTLNYGAFRECTALTSITLPNGLEEIDDMAFRGCSALTGIVIPDSVTTLGIEVFEDCEALRTAHLGTGLTSTGTGTFRNSGLRSVEFSPTVTKIDAYAFYGTAFTAIDIPETITNIGMRSFSNCGFLVSATVNNANAEFEGIIGEDPFNGCNDNLTMYGHSRSTTQTYAETKGYNFLSIDPCIHENTHPVVVSEPTCTETGISQDVCDNCGFVVSETETPALGHLWTLEDSFDNTETDGHIYKSYICDNCGADKTELEHVEYVEGYYTYTNTATCTRAGIETYTCTVEGCGQVTRNVARKGNHTVDNYTVTKQPTCTEKGTKQGVCSLCGETVVQDIDPTGHTNELITSIDCTADDGHIYEFYTCSVCGEDTITPTHVEWVEGYYTENIISPAQCVIPGVRRDTCDVENCGETRLVTLEATGAHDWYETTRTQPTCTAQGRIYYACHNCNLTKTENIEALGHDYQLVDGECTEPTCTTPGMNYYSCSRCSMTREENIPAPGHTPDPENYTVTKEATCTVDGKAQTVCLVCGLAYEQKLEAPGHDYTYNEEEVANQPGHIRITPVCSVCGFVDNATIEHREWVEGYYETSVITHGTCVVTGVSRDTCIICGETRTNTTEATGHVYSFSQMRNDGTLVYTCSVCNNESTYAPAIVSGMFINYVNTSSDDTRLGYAFDLTNDGFINAKDYSLLNKAVKRAEAN